MVDEFAAIKEVDPFAYIQARLSKSSDGAVMAMMQYGRPVIRDGVIDVTIEEKRGVAQMLADLGGEHDRFLQWVAAKRAQRLKAEGRENLLTDEDVSALLSLELGKMANGHSRPVVYADALARLNQFNEAVLKVAKDSGLIDQAFYDLMRSQPYVPFYRLLEGSDFSGPRNSGGLVNQQALRRLKGGTQQINADLLQNMMLNWSHLLTASAKNRAALSTLDAAFSMDIAHTVDGPEKGSVKVMRDGQVEHWMIHDPYLMQAVSALNYAPSEITRAMSKVKHWLTFGVTVNPAFKLRNLMRDSLQSLALGDMSLNVPKNLYRGWKATASDSQIYASMLAGGGVMKYGSLENSDLARRQVEKLGGQMLDKQGWRRFVGQAETLFEAYQELGDRGENMNRAALYERLRAKNVSHAEAIFQSRDLMDFTLQGGWPIVRFLNQTVPFLNARVQGLYKLGRSAKEDPKRAMTIIGSVAAASLGLLALYHDDEDWKKREDWDRDSYWWFKVGGVAYRIPKPFEVGMIGTIAERTAEWMFDKEMTNKRYMQRLAFAVSQTLSFNPVPQMIRPLLDVYANKDDFTGRAIETQADQNLMPKDRYNERTSEAARLLGRMGLPNPLQLVKGDYDALSPKQIDYLLRGYFGWAATVGTTITDYPLRMLAGRGERPDMKLRDVFLAGNFAETLPSNSSRYVTQLYEQARDAQQAMASYRAAMKAGDPAKAEAIQNARGDQLMRAKRLERATQILSKLNQQAHQIEADRKLSGQEKRRQLDEIEQQRDEMARQAQAVD